MRRGKCNEDLVEASEQRGCDRERSNAVPKCSWRASIRSRAKGSTNGEEQARSQAGTALLSCRASHLGTNQARGRYWILRRRWLRLAPPRQPLDPLANPSDPAAMSSPGASKRYRMERERREREAHEQSERTRLKRAAAKHVMGFWNAALAAGWRTIFYPIGRHCARHRLPLAPRRLSSVPADGRDRLAQDRHPPQRLARHRGPRDVLQALLAAPAVREAARGDEAILVRL